MEAGTLRSAKEGLCAMCYQKAADKCAKCKQVWYCSPFCQRKHWHLGHAGDCGLADLPLDTAVPPPPSRLLRESVEQPVLGDAAWRKLVEAIDPGPREGPPRGLRNLGNSCYMNAVLQGLFHSAPALMASCQEHCGRSKCTPQAAGALRPGQGCFRCDLQAVARGCLNPRPPPLPDSRGLQGAPFASGDRVRLRDLGAADLNGRHGLILGPAASACSTNGYPGKENSAPRFEVRLLGEKGSKAVRPENLELCCKVATGPVEVVRWLPRLSDEFTFGQQEDAHEFMRSLLRLVEDEELKEHAEACGSGKATVLPVNADLTASPSRIFGGLLVSQCTCTNRACGASSFSFESFMDLSLNITEATASLEDTLRLFTAPERLDKKNGWRCQTCNETVRARKQLTIYSAPSCLVLQLKRFRAVLGMGERGKVTRPVSFRRELNLRPYLCAGAPDAAKPLLYELRAVVVHLDKAGFSHFGHYVAYVRCVVPASHGSQPVQQWFLLDDSQSVEVSEEEVLRQEAYLLIYSRAGEAPPPQRLHRGTSGSGNKSAEVSAGIEDGAPVKCRGRAGTVCSFFASSDGLCTRCYTEEHGRPPPAPAAPAAAPTPVKAATKAEVSQKSQGKSGSGSAASVNGSTSGKAAAPSSKKKVGPNDPCPCGSGRKYKKCHGSNA